MLPDKSRNEILKAIYQFDRDFRNRKDWLNWEKNENQFYAIEYNNRRYPVKKIISLTTGVPVSEFIGGKPSNNYIRKRGFEVVDIREDIKEKNIRVFLAPASNETSQTHMKDSLTPGKQYKELASFLSDEGKSILSRLDPIPTWGCVSSLKGRWDQLQSGDWVLFYVRGVFIYAGKVLYKERNSELSQRIWGTTEQGNPWELMFFFEKLFDVNIQLDPIRKFSDYSNNWILQGFTRLKESALQRIIEDYGTFEKFLGLEESIISKDKGGEIITEKEGFMNYLKNQGYYFKTDIVENFLLSLKVKPFVILTGNSGTGKTKIAQLFAKYLEQTNNKDIKRYIESEVTVGKSAESGGWAFKRDDFFEIFPQVKKYEGSFPIEVNNQKSKGRLVLTPRIFFDSKDTEMKKMLDSLAQKESTKKVPLKIEIPRISSTIGNYYSLIPVGANWTENRHIVGFHNVITNKYQKTAALDVLLLANEISDKPHFLILDEMNLSHVERYFADFLSAMESDEKIPLHDCDKIEEIPNQISIPQNLSVIGTVNVDETTYMFSPKVLDRANTIEFNTHPAKEYMSGKTSNQISEGNFQYLENILSDIDVRKWDINKLKDEFSTIKTSKNILLWDVLSDEINKFQECLRKAGFDFGFRIVNEILRFMYVAWKYENKKNPWNNWERYFDAQIKQKMLPKIHGSQRSIGELFKEMISFCISEKSDKEPRSIENIDKIAKYKTSALKIQEMDKILYDQRYVSFTR